MSETRRGLSRRALAKGAAWAAPAVAFTAAAPAFAASGTIDVTTSVDAACKSPGNSTVCGKSYLFTEVLVTSRLSKSATVRFTSVTGTGLANCATGVAGNNYLIVNETFPLAAGASKTFILQQCSGSSANLSGHVTITWAWVAADGTTGTGSITLNFTSTPPDCPETICPKRMD